MGCLRGLLVQVGCLVLLIAAAVLGWIYRDRLWAEYRRMRGLPPPSEARFALPATGAAERAAASLTRLTERGGSAYVDLTAEEVAALVDRGLAQAPRRVFDSVAVALEPDLVRLRGVLDLSSVPANVLGPFATALSGREPVAASGPLSVDGRGRVRWTVTALRIRDFPFPRSVTHAILGALKVPGAEDGALVLPLSAAVGDVRVSSGRARVYRASPQ